MFYAYPIVGETVQIRNFSKVDVPDICYTFKKFPETTIPTIAPNQYERFLIATGHLSKDRDLIFFFRNNPEKKFVFQNAVKKHNIKELWTYFYVKIVEVDGELLVEEDSDGRQFYYNED